MIQELLGSKSQLLTENNKYNILYKSKQRAD